MGGQGLFQYKAGSRERGRVGQVIANNLNCHKNLFDGVTPRGVRDRFTLLSKNYKAKMSEEIKSTGTGGEELTEFEMLMEELIALSEESGRKGEAETESSRKSANANRNKAIEMRQQAMQAMAWKSRKRRRAEDQELTPCLG